MGRLANFKLGFSVIFTFGHLVSRQTIDAESRAVALATLMHADLVAAVGSTD